MDWDATSYTAGLPHCLRRTDRNLLFPGDLVGEVHADGRIWSHALWDLNLGLGRDMATTVIVEAHFWMNPTITMPRAAEVTVSIAQQLYGPVAAAATRLAFANRGIL